MTHRWLRPVFALIGVAGLIVATLLALLWLASFHPALALIAVVLGAIIGAVSFATTSPSDLYAGLVEAGLTAIRELTGIAQIVLVTLGWAVVAVVVAILAALPMVILGSEGPVATISGWVMILGFFGCLIVGPIWSIRRLRRHRRSP